MICAVAVCSGWPLTAETGAFFQFRDVQCMHLIGVYLERVKTLLVGFSSSVKIQVYVLR